MRVAPLQRAEHVLRAALPPDDVAEALEMSSGEPCLLLLRRTWSSNIVASCARLYYPASRYEFAGSAAREHQRQCKTDATSGGNASQAGNGAVITRFGR